MCNENDSIEHAFFECQSFKKLCDESLQWFNNAKQTCYIRIYIQVNKSHNRTERESKGVGLDILISKSYFQNYADHAETVSCKLVDFRKTRFHDSARQSEAGSTNKKKAA